MASVAQAVSEAPPSLTLRATINLLDLFSSSSSSVLSSALLLSSFPGSVKELLDLSQFLH